MPLAYPFGAGQPLGCKICGPAAEVSPIGSTASVGPFGVLTNSSPSLQMHSFCGHACRRRAGQSHLPQGKSLQFAGFRLGKLRDKSDRTRIFVRRDLALDVLLQRRRQRGVGGDAGRKDHIGLDDHAARLVGGADDAAFGHRRMGQQCGFDIRTGDIVAGRDNHVVRSGHERKAALLVADERIDRQIPAITHIIRLPRIREIAASRRAANRKPADGARRQFVHVIVDDLCLVTGNRVPRRSGDGVAYSVRNEDMQQFRAADPVENRLARLAGPVLENRRRQGLPRRNRKTQRRKIGALFHRGHHRPIRGRRGKANRGLVGLNDLDHLAGCRVF